MLNYQLNVLLGIIIGTPIAMVLGRIMIDKPYEVYHDRMGGA